MFTDSKPGEVGGQNTDRAPVRPFESSAELTPRNPIDELVLRRLKKLGIRPARICSDEVFLHRSFLDVIGTLPTPDVARQFLQDKNPKKRAALIDHLLQRDEFADYWAMKWCDLLRVKSEFPINLWPNAVQAYHHWIRTSVRQNLAYDRFARQLLTSSGSNFRTPPVNFYRALDSRKPEGIAQAVALTFMGTRADRWPKARLAGMAAFFAQVGYKYTGEWKEEIVFHDPSKPARRVAAFPDGKPAHLAPGQDPRTVFADWLITPTNPWFARSIANRVWSWFLGRGIIHEPDDIRPDNPPSNPELLAWLEKDLIAGRYDLKRLFRTILNTDTYQLSSIPRSRNPRAEACFASYRLRRLEAEVLADALNQITGTTETYSSMIPEPYTFIPEGQRSIALADGSITSAFLAMFGRSPRDLGTESERNSKPTADQRLHFLNSSHIQRKIERGPKVLALLRNSRTSRDLVDGLYLAVLSRYPTDEERAIVEKYAGPGKVIRPGAAVDLLWALINSAEFLYRH